MAHRTEKGNSNQPGAKEQLMNCAQELLEAIKRTNISVVVVEPVHRLDENEES